MSRIRVQNPAAHQLMNEEVKKWDKTKAIPSRLQFVQDKRCDISHSTWVSAG